MTSGRNMGLLLAAACAIPACAPTPRGTQPSKPARSTAETPARPESTQATPKIAPGRVSTISMEDFFLLHESGKTLLFDARPTLIYRLGHIPGAINLPKNRCDEVIAVRNGEIRNALAAGKTIVVYCTGTTCPDAHTVAMHLSGSGHPASVFPGGWDSWKEAGLPVE